VQVDRVGHAVQGRPGEHARQSEAVVPVHVGEADPRDLSGRNTGVDHLALGPLTRIKQDALAVEPQQVAVVVAGPGRDLGGCAEHHQFTHGTESPTPLPLPSSPPVRWTGLHLS
jgi:hypothetical protein